MNCSVAVIVDAETCAARQAIQAVTDWFMAWEQCLSGSLVSSELNQLNATHGGQWVRVSSDLWAVLQSATWACDWSHGFVSPLIGTAPYDVRCCCRFASDPVEPVEPVEPIKRKVTQAIASDEPGWLELDAVHHSARLPLCARLDVSGITQGWVAQQAVQRLAAFGPTLVDVGGDIAMSARAGNRPWPIEVAAASGDSSPDLLCVSAGGVATSGQEFRRWRTENIGQIPINTPIDIRTGQPAATDVITATVMAPDVMMAEAAAQTVLILGSRAGMKWLESRTQLAGSLVLANGEIVRSSRLKTYLWR